MTKILVIAALVCVSGIMQIHGKEQTIRLVTWNLQWFPGKSPYAKPDAVRSHINEVREAVLAMRPDILVLQEVSNEPALSEAVSGSAGLTLAVMSRFKNAAGFPDSQQLAIFSKFPAQFVYSSAWAHGWAGPPRGFAYAALKLDHGTVNVVGLHLKSNLGDPQGNTAKREDAAEQVLEHLRVTQAETRSPDARVIICGDFNTDMVNKDVPSERTFKLLAEAGYFWCFEGIPHNLRITCPAKGRYPAACFDHVFMRNLGRPVASPVGSITGSDHLPVVVEFVVGG